MSTDALELAMALHQAPIQRFALRDRPLPENMGLALQIASATQPQLDEAATLFSEPRETVLEAVRFYLHQVLFEPGTDAYRVLGLSPAADGKQIRQHYIFLQRWLHPDRRGEDWEAVFATKVNWAWQQLRNPKAREAYDGSRRPELRESSGELPDTGPMPLPAWSAAPVHRASRHWLRGITISGLLVFCAGLFYLAVTREDYLDTDAPILQAGKSDASPQYMPGSAAESGGRANPGDSIFMARSGPVPVGVDGSQPANDAAGVDPGEQTDVAATGQAPRRTLTQAAQPESEGAAAAMASVRSPSADRAGAAGSSPQPATRLPRSTAVPAVAAEPSVDTGSSGRAVSNQAGTAALASTASASAASAERTAAPTKDSIGDETASSPATPADAAGAGQPPGPVNEATDASPIPAATVGDPLERFELARERLRSMLSYLRSQTTELPQWSDMPGQLTAERERNALHSRNGHADIDRFALDPPTWRMSDATVALEATYHVDANRKVAEKGRFYLDMAWRDGGWKITRIKMLPSP